MDKIMFYNETYKNLNRINNYGLIMCGFIINYGQMNSNHHINIFIYY
jgi:hypothetical protein